MIAILDADREGFLRSERSLVQIIGRAARNVRGRVILYADEITASMERAISETNRRRTIQNAFNKKYGITPASIKKDIRDTIDTTVALISEAAMDTAEDVEAFDAYLRI